MNNMTNNFNYAIALSGGIATGKSTVASLFMLHGFLTIDADKITHRLLDENHWKIADMFGIGYVENGKVLRKKLGFLIFNDVDEKKKLEIFLHPLIKKEIIKEALLFEEQKKPYLIDIPLFFENRNYDIINSIVVYIPKDLQIKRLIKRDKCNKNDALSRINSQMDIEDKKQLATFIIDNTKDLRSLQNEVERVKKLLLEKI